MGGEYLGFEPLLSPNPPSPPAAFGSGRKRLFWEQHPCQKLWGSLNFGFLVGYCLLISSYSIFILFRFVFFLNKMFLDMFSVQHLINRAHNREDSEISSIASCIHLWFAFINHN